jgi:DNA polymerase III subunit gamma/tau
MSYLVFARKWRPQTFGEIVGQKAVAQTLMNALASNRIGHAYLFAGPRGVGKTTAARILAKALNCETGISREPCNTCSSCQDITQGRHLDVIEVDGASNRGIDEVRELRENVRFSPYRGRYKVIVIDEVHMLTEPAFNALLKTLEEPPSRVVFILATTESHKVPMTILSRCQRFEFRRIASADIIERLEEMGKAEDIKIDPEGLKMIASAAEGSLRDAQSLLDQVVSYSGARVRAEDVSTILGLVDQEQVEKAVLHVLEGEGAALLQLVEELCSAGHDLRLFSIALLEWVRDLMVAHITDSATSLARESGAISSWLRKNGGLSFPELDRLLQILIRAEVEMRRSPYPRFILEMALLRMSEGKKLTSVEEIWGRLSRMEERLALREGTPRKDAPPRTEGAKDGKAAVPPASSGPQEEEQEPMPEPALEDDAAPKDPSINWLHDPRWQEFKRLVKREKVSLAPLLEHFSSVCPQEKDLMILVEGANTYLSEALEDQANRKILEGAARIVFGQEFRIRYEFERKKNDKRGEGKRASVEEKSTDFHPISPPMPSAPANSLLEQALEVFEGRVVKRG